jgi:hypothetical protein
MATRVSPLLYKYIPEKGLANLANYKYHGSDKSLIANYILQRFWGRAVFWLPTWMAYVTLYFIHVFSAEWDSFLGDLRLPRALVPIRAIILLATQSVMIASAFHIL